MIGGSESTCWRVQGHHLTFQYRFNGLLELSWERRTASVWTCPLLLLAKDQWTANDEASDPDKFT